MPVLLVFAVITLVLAAVGFLVDRLAMRPADVSSDGILPASIILLLAGVLFLVAYLTVGSPS